MVRQNFGTQKEIDGNQQKTTSHFVLRGLADFPEWCQENGGAALFNYNKQILLHQLQAFAALFRGQGQNRSVRSRRW
jgi:hypothetical protein